MQPLAERQLDLSWAQSPSGHWYGAWAEQRPWLVSGHALMSVLHSPFWQRTGRSDGQALSVVHWEALDLQVPSAQATDSAAEGQTGKAGTSSQRVSEVTQRPLEHLNGARGSQTEMGGHWTSLATQLTLSAQRIGAVAGQPLFAGQNAALCAQEPSGHWKGRDVLEHVAWVLGQVPAFSAQVPSAHLKGLVPGQPLSPVHLEMPSAHSPVGQNVRPEEHLNVGHVVPLATHVPSEQSVDCAGGHAADSRVVGQLAREFLQVRSGQSTSPWLHTGPRGQRSADATHAPEGHANWPEGHTGDGSQSRTDLRQVPS
eukprot:comp22419_c0_seq1/m.54711 comp22419_c0_seq1/g.54711  ORF comp22419_c0_seq1/g.54711 comp22419_c0_seq1/m.54711 type:complete len:313 (-) comp22419_c0_seq1:4-942(-)